MNEKNLMSLLGLAQKAGKIVSGDFAVQGAIKSGKARMLIVANNASDATKKEYQYQAESRDIVIYYALSKEQLGGAIGKALRAAVVITDNGFVKPLVRALEE
ncbi:MULTISPECIES: ribosomal L7Ae/L30e/S12e/Gadd45 family protein [Sporomusa]|jgi:ribosomal protein L7Ae-like RNA K-turn-binding protein|uniref:Ribosomal protein YlxQ n=2 Tax=Sporomusa TaxID=2375 RepID=A0ABM9VXN1_9FIRM|nr:MULTISPECIES: ribosomal L7Ae/L30e/S12e/Gadd45 family protein [Sporomusa]MCM0760146.1 ribosomal L7Ae/L30e/S12e/Gadd45 family protein [Sporomusa sphaeroides DSM 2875]OLS58205.1 putative ribosomal protein YlxQ [Sporomusa sphaeroides DSM 2875]CVK17608.1 putative ribosomal protein YlxQ [Sporomusa sphaeroides DSM 2875]SCM80415.1 Ribosomal protein L7Ae/L30e/S12e/gadd45 [uncultured Sporomusa sp.]HML31538.1 ribosomal L7Ae/L30e/S12e/Gadd45 family protein [Sporomusa sphaeroides]